MWGLSEWSFDDLSYKHPNEFPEIARELAFMDQDETDDPNDPREQVQTTILSRRKTS